MEDPTTVDVFAAAAVRRREVADLLSGLDEAQLATPSLCAGWDVRTVGAHLADAAAPGALGEFLRALLKAGGRLHRANDEAARRAGRRPVAVITGRPVGFAPRGRLRGLRLTGTDLDRAWGTGAEVRGRGIDLLMAACGRTAVLPRLDGPGRHVLTTRLVPASS